MNQKNGAGHLMRLDRIFPSGAEEWHCIYCERRVLKQRHPVYQEIILEHGVGNPKDDPGSRNDTELSEELWAALEEVLSSVDFE